MIDFESYKYNRLDEPIILGTYSEVNARSKCPFCRLVFKALAPKLSGLHWQPDQISLANEECWRLSVEQSPYDLTGTGTITNRLDLRAYAKSFDDVAHRFVVHGANRFGAESISGQIQFLASRSARGRHRNFFGRRVHPDAVDIGLLRSWLDKCTEGHAAACCKSDFPRHRLPDGFRVIDVYRKAIVKPTTSVTYFALSYVWGEDAMFAETGMKPVVLKRAMLEMHGNSESTQSPARLPKTIDDAIRFTREMGCQYLWADALCIVQDDDANAKHAHLSRMDAIYSCAALTIVAGSGRHADYGLPGLYGTQRKASQHLETINTIPMVTTLPTYSDVENSRDLVWSSRGWTLQEKLLSKRILLFTEDQVYFKCSEAIFSEQAWNDVWRISRDPHNHPQKFRWSAIHLAQKKAASNALESLMGVTKSSDAHWRLAKHVASKRGDASSKDFYDRGAIIRECAQRPWFKSYASAMQECTQRTLKDPGDLFFSINGILRLLGDGPDEFVHGLPRTEFAKSLLWRPAPGARIASRGCAWPSWSWASWQFDAQGVKFFRPENEVLLNLMKASDGQWFGNYTNDQSNDTEVSPFSIIPANPIIPVSDSAFVASEQAPLFAEINLQNCLAFLPFLVPRPRYIFSCHQGVTTPISEDAIDNPKYRRKLKDAFPHGKRLSRDHPLLLIETPVVRFRVGKALDVQVGTDPESTALYELVDDQRRCVGEVWLTQGFARRRNSRRVDCLTLSRTWKFEKAEIDDNYRPRWRFNSFAQSPDDALCQLDDRETRRFQRKVYRQYSRLLRFQDAASELEAGERSAPDGIIDTVLENLLGKRTKDRNGVSTDRFEQMLAAFETKGSNLEGDRQYVEEHHQGGWYALLAALKGEELPQFLWKVVEVLIIQREGEVAKRVGVGKIIYQAWRSAGPSHEQTMLA